MSPFGSSGSGDRSSEVYYRLARSVVRITGTVTTDFDPETSQPRQSATSDIGVGVEADRRLDWRCRLPMDSSRRKEKEFELAFEDDGRLKSASATVSGTGTAVLEAGVRVVGFLAGAALAALSKRALDGQGERSFNAVLAAENPTLHARREAYRAAIGSLQDELAAYGTRVAASAGGYSVIVEGRTLNGALAWVRAESAVVEAEVEAWRSVHFPSSTEDYAFSEGTDRLPQLVSATPTTEFDLEGLTPQQRDAATKLGVVVARVGEVDEGASNSTVDELKPGNGVWYRTSRPTSLALYERELGSDGDFRLRTVTPTWVIDSASQLGFIRFDAGLFAKNTGKLGFGGSGALTSLASTQGSGLKGFAGAIGAAPGQLQDSLGQAAAITESLGKLSSARAGRRLADVTRRRKQLEAEIAEKGVLATRSQREKLAELKVQAEVAEAEKKLAPTPVAANHDLEDQVSRMKLELEMKRLEVEMKSLARDDPPAAG